MTVRGFDSSRNYEKINTRVKVIPVALRYALQAPIRPVLFHVSSTRKQEPSREAVG